MLLFSAFSVRAGDSLKRERMWDVEATHLLSVAFVKLLSFHADLIYLNLDL